MSIQMRYTFSAHRGMDVVDLPAVQKLMVYAHLAPDLSKIAIDKLRFVHTIANLAPATIGEDGRLMEWHNAFEEAEPGH